MITTAQGDAVRPLALAAHPEQDLRCVERALDGGVNFFFFYSAGQRDFVEPLARLARGRRDEMVIATGSGGRRPRSLRAAREKACAALGTQRIDVFFAEYVNPRDDLEAIFAASGVLDELQRWKADGSIRLVGASVHDRSLARRLAGDARVDVLMHRYNMAHRKAAEEVFPAARDASTSVVALTATRWGSLLEPHSAWPGGTPDRRRLLPLLPGPRRGRAGSLRAEVARPAGRKPERSRRAEHVRSGTARLGALWRSGLWPRRRRV